MTKRRTMITRATGPLRLGLAAAMVVGIAALSAGAHAAELVLVEPGHEPAVIVVPETPSPEVAHAAEVLRGTIERMTGRSPLVVPESPEDMTDEAAARGRVRIKVGPTRAAVAAGLTFDPNDFEDRDRPDRYRLRTSANAVHVLGTDGDGRRGTVLATYDLLRRLGCGWYGPDPRWHVVPETQTLAIPELDVDETAAFAMRHIWLVNDRTLMDAWRTTGMRIHSGGHMLSRLVPRSLDKDHPDWFRPGQPDICHPEVIAYVAERLRRELERSEGFRSFGIGANDTHLWPDTVHTRAVGNPGPQSLYFANGVARELRRTHPGRFALSFYAYWVTQAPPPPDLKAEPEVYVFFVNEGNKAKPWSFEEPAEMDNFIKSNARQRQHLEGWLATGAKVGIYDWWIPGFQIPAWRDLPWYAGEIAFDNLRTWRDLGIRHITIENGYETNPWPLRWPLYHAAARALWNPDHDANAVLREACDRLFGPASEPMFDFYRQLELAVARSPHFQQNWNLPPAEWVYPPELAERASALLRDAAALAETDAQRARIADEQASWDRAVARLRTLWSDEASTVWSRVEIDGRFMFWRSSRLSAGIVRSLVGIPGHIPLYAILPDGEAVLTDDADAFDTAAGVTFRTTPPGVD